jgi:hypothetical protein
MTVMVSLTRDFRQTIVERVRRDPEFAKAPLDEAARLFLNGEGDAARLVLRDLVKAAVGFKALAAKTGKPAKRVFTGCSRKTATRPWTILPPLSALFARLSGSR